MPTNTYGLFTRTKLAIALGTCGFFCSIPSVFAQDTAEEKNKDEVEELVIVGSLLRQTSLKTIHPTQLFLRETATESGLNSTTDLLQSTSFTGGAEQINNGYTGFSVDGGPGVNTVSLRGLGATRTLVLINGRRVAPSGTRGAVGSADLNVLPTGIIERIEVLRDGASSIYGSDAISGVINVVTKDDLNGVTLEGEFNDPTEGAGEQTRFSISGGMKEENFRLLGSFDFYEREALTLADRDWTRCNQYLLRNPTTGASLDYIDPETGKSKCYPISLVGANGSTINTIALSQITSTNYASFGLTSPVVGATGTTDTRFDRFRPNAAITTGLVGFEGVGGGTNSTNVRDTFHPDMLKKSLISPVRNYTGFLEGRFDLGNAEVYAEMLASKRQSNQTTYRQITLDYRRGSPLIPTNLAFSNMSSQPTTEGQNVGVRAFIGFGADTSYQEVDFLKPTIGIKGDLTLPDWQYDAYFSYAKSKSTYEANAFLIDKLTYAGNAVAAPSGIDSSLVQDGLTCSINLTRPGEKCIHYPRLTAAVIDGDLPQEFRDYIFQTTVGNTKFYESIQSLIMTGPLFNLPAGEVQAAVGLEHRLSQINDQPDDNSIRGNIDGSTSAVVTIGKDHVSEIYTEIEVPILSEQPFAETLSVNTSFRYTDYDSYGSDETYKLGMIYSPTDWISFRAAQGTSFRAPALFEQFQGATSGFLANSNDPCNSYGTNPNSERAANCSSEGLPPTFSATSSIVVISEGGAEAGLKAETSKNLTYGIIFTPQISDTTDFSMTVDYFDIEISNGVEKAGATQILSRCYDDSDFLSDGGYCRLVSRNAANNNQLTVSNPYTNISTDIARGIDVDLTLDQELPLGTFLTDITMTRYYAQERKLFEGDLLEEFNGGLNKPKYGATANIAYKLDNWKLTYGIEWVSGMSGYKEAKQNPETSTRDLEVPSYFEHRISLRYQADNWKTIFGVRNLTNETPPEISAGPIFARVGNSPLYSGYDYVGRELFVNFQIQL